MLWTLDDIRRKVRKITAMPGQNQLSEGELNIAINRYWTTIFPAELKVREQESVKTLLLRKGEAHLEFPEEYLTPYPVCYVDNYKLRYFLSYEQFIDSYPPQYDSRQIDIGDGQKSLYSFTVPKESLLPGTVFIYAGEMIISDAFDSNNDGSLTLDFISGEGTVGFNTPPATGIPIFIKYAYMKFARPLAILYLEGKFSFRPVPDMDYEFRFEGRTVPEILTEGTLPIRPEWGDVIAYGTALEIFAETGNMDAFDRYTIPFRRYEAVALARTVEDLNYARTKPIF